MDPSIADPLAFYLWETILSWYCYQGFNERHRQVVTVPLREIEVHLIDMSFASFCMLLRLYIQLRRGEVGIEFDRTTMDPYVNWPGESFRVLRYCQPCYERVFCFYFPEAMEVSQAREVHEHEHEA